jgi:hypothetical protein
MGKSFEKEMYDLNKTYISTFNNEDNTIINFLSSLKEKIILLIGSGGSYSVASAIEYLCARKGFFAKAITPLSLNQYKEQIRNYNAILVTAGGRNSDSLNSYKFLHDLEPQNLLTICMKKDAPIKTLQSTDLHNFFYEFDLPTKKDGYLAVNSLIASILIFSKSMYEIYNDDFYKLSPEFDFSNDVVVSEKINNVLFKESIIVLHGGITTPIAIDLESKFSETALGNIQLVDFRNFAHGRHFWLDHRKDSTSIISLIGKSEEKIAAKTLSLIPDSIPRYEVYLQEDNIMNMLQAYYKMFTIVNIAGKIQNINPGKPKVVDYGKKMYHISYNFSDESSFRKLKKSNKELAISRKIGMNPSYDTLKKYEEAYEHNVSLITSKNFKGIIFDYDGTLHIKNKITEIENDIFNTINELLGQGIIIGIATGRGKSVRKALRNMIKNEFWNLVAIGYYNGAEIGLLSDDTRPDKNIEVPIVFNAIRNEILKNRTSKIIIDETENPFQLTVISNDGQNSKHEFEYLKEICYKYPEVKVVSSSHSMDIILRTTNKIAVSKYYLDNKFANSINDFIYIGDSGNLTGNDFEMLFCETGLSVDNVSKNMDYCWNYAPMGKRNLEATKYYMDAINIKSGENTFMINLKRG